MAFIPKLPTWHTDVCTAYRLNDAGEWESLGGITGQIYQPLRNQDDEIGGLMYLMIPKETSLVLRDSYNGTADVIEVSMPGGNYPVCSYLVRECKPRWKRFPNQHILVELQRLGRTEWDSTNHTVPVPVPPPPPDPDPDPIPPPGDPTCMTIAVSGVHTALADDCPEYNGEFELAYDGYDTWKSATFECSDSITGIAQWVATKDSTFWTIVLNLGVGGDAISVLCYWRGGVDVESPIPFVKTTSFDTACVWDTSTLTLSTVCDGTVTGYRVTIADVTNNGCSDCAELNGVWNLDQPIADTWLSDDFDWSCNTFTELPMRWQLWTYESDPAYWIIQIGDDGSVGNRVFWRKLKTDWDGLSDTTFDFWLSEFAAPACTYPDSIVVEALGGSGPLPLIGSGGGIASGIGMHGVGLSGEGRSEGSGIADTAVRIAPLTDGGAIGDGGADTAVTIAPLGDGGAIAAGDAETAVTIAPLGDGGGSAGGSADIVTIP